MALALPLAILDACGTSNSIARFTDGNATPPKSLTTLGASEGNTPPVAISDWVGCVDAKSVTYCRFASNGSCGSSGPVTVCSCLVNSPAMVLGDRYDASIQWLLKIDSGSIQSCMKIYCNGATLANCLRTIVGTTSGTYVVQNVDYNDTIRMDVCATAFGPSSIGCACTCLSALTDQQQASFVMGTGKSNFVVAVGN